MKKTNLLYWEPKIDNVLKSFVLLALTLFFFNPLITHANPDWWNTGDSDPYPCSYCCSNDRNSNPEPVPPSPPQNTPQTPVLSAHNCLNNGNAVKLNWQPVTIVKGDNFIKQIFTHLFKTPVLTNTVAHAGGGGGTPAPTITSYSYQINGQNPVNVGMNTSSGQITITPGVSYQFRVQACASNGSCTWSAYQSFSCAPPPPTVTLSANPSTVSYNNSSTLNWTVTNATSCTASNGWSGSKSHTGGNQSTGNLTASTTYSLACTGPAGSASATTRVNVTIPLPTVTLQANPTKVIHGNPSTLTWTSTNATSCTAFDGWSGNKSTGNGTQSTGPLSANTQYRLVCTGVGGTAQAIASVAVETGTGANLVVDKPNPREKDTLNFTYNVGTSVPNTCVLRRGAVSVLSITSPSGTYQTTASAGETRYILDCPGNPAEVTVKTLPVFQET